MPTGMSLALGAGGWMKGTLAKTLASQIAGTAGRFIAGSDLPEAAPTLRDNWTHGIAATIDLLGEAVVSDREADDYQERYLDLVRTLASEARSWPANTRLEQDHLGAIPRANVSIKLSSLTPKFDALDVDSTIARVRQRLDPILNLARDLGVFINFDMESYATKGLILSIFRRCAEQIDFPAGIAIQAYLTDGPDDAERIIAWAKQAGRRVTVRLVKGAYWDHEVIHAQERGWPIPVWLTRAHTDACYERMAEQILRSTPTRAGEGGVMLAAGSHNARSLAHAFARAEQVGLPPTAIEVQMLYGMAEGLKAAVVEHGVRLREYMPIGALAPGMAYLVRRLLENSSNQSWLLQGQDKHADIEALIAPPAPPSSPPQMQSPSVDGFRNEPLRDFSGPARVVFGKAVQQTALPTVPITATPAHADAAVAAARRAFPMWRDTPPQKRADILRAAADTMRRRRDELAAIVLKESRKPWRDADADICEAIDFFTFYAMRAPRLFEPKRLGDFVGQRDELWHEPLGVAAIISPWNFPLAICCGMTAAALVCGNIAIVKPAEQSPAIARVLCEILWEAGVPRDVLHFLPGAGDVGAALVRHRDVDLIAFTGSKAVGLDILKAAGDVDEAAGHAKRVVCEMGGKNAIIIDESADLDEAVVAVRDSAFGYAGQKCSAASRAIVLPGVRAEFIDRLVEATRHLRVGDPEDPATDVPPVIDDEAAARIWKYIELGKTEGKLLYGGGAAADDRSIPPHIFGGIRPEHRLFREEIFGPVLSIVDAADFDDAIRLALTGPYRLTGGVFSRTPSNLEKARREFRVGNLYLNRGVTGALVGRQPFGGQGLSGLGTKAGGDEYLLQFVYPRACTENTERRGFAPGMAE
jgi:RHH-type proline utilization regulon transcriptional repressor/proline dehydrogenase/delta 1-pyrroline-5-carboxylate dehydrogenase